jgi:hypothetical protein
MTEIKIEEAKSLANKLIAQKEEGGTAWHVNFVTTEEYEESSAELEAKPNHAVYSGEYDALYELYNALVMEGFTDELKNFDEANWPKYKICYVYSD